MHSVVRFTDMARGVVVAGAEGRRMGSHCFMIVELSLEKQKKSSWGRWGMVQDECW